VSDRQDRKRLLFGITALADLGQEVTSGRDFREVMKTALHVICGMLAVPHAALYAYDDRRRDLAYLTAKGYDFAGTPPLSISRRQIRSLPANDAVPVSSPLCAPFVRRNRSMLSRLEARTFLPLVARDSFVGIIALSRPLSRAADRKDGRDLVRAAAHQCAIALHSARLFGKYAEQAAENRRLYENMRRIYHDTIQAFATAIDAKDQYTKHHSFRVAHYAAAIARELKWKDNDVEAIYVAGLLHDIGKLALDVDLINKGDALTPADQEKIKRHAEVSYEIVSRIRLPWEDVPQYIRQHHERPDGTGYPDALPGQELSDGAKILALADAYDAMTSDRPYRARLTPAKAVQEIRRCEGTQFDGRISSILCRLIENGKAASSLKPPVIQRLGGEMALPIVIDTPWRADA
jgi:putative nucleotidyltransferase with HDIG domain